MRSREDAVDERLRAALVWSDEAPHEGVDMNADAVTARIRELAEMSSLCLELERIGASLRRS